MKKNKDKNKTYYKQTGLTKYAQEPLAADDIYIQKELLAHNGIDRDRERFPEDLLEDYARTLPGKSLLEVHDRSRLPIGLYFDAKTEEISKDKFKEITGEDIRLPEGTKKATVIFAWIYTLRKEWNQKLIDNLAGGIYRHRSIGFTASDFTAIKGEFDQVLYFEYVGPGEAREGSIVYLGAQPGAVMQKGADVQKISDVENYKDAQIYRKKGEEAQNLNSWLTTHKKETGKDEQGENIENNVNNKKGGKKSMEELEKLLKELSKAFDKPFDKDNVIDGMKSLLSAEGEKHEDLIKEKNTKIEELETKVSALNPLAADGKAYRDGLVDECVKMKAKLGDVSEKEEEQKSVRATVEKFDIDYLKSEKEILEKRVNEKFDAEGQLRGDTNRDKSKDGKKENVLIPDIDEKK
jgi:hypothetical protein